MQKMLKFGLLIICSLSAIGLGIKKIKRSLKEETYISSPPELFEQGFGFKAQHSPITRSQFIQQISLKLDTGLKCLEIGPYFKPAFKGPNVKYFDILNQDELVNRFKKIKDSASEEEIKNIPFIHFCEPTGDMSIIKESFDLVFSSHNIEHQVDFIRHLQQVEHLLTKGGKFYITLPDKRYSFDHFVAGTSLSDVIATHINKTKVHPLRTVLAMKCETTHNDPRMHWRGEHGNIDGVDLSCHTKALKEYQESNGAYIDAHRWRFTPQLFEIIINSLRELGYINFKIGEIYDTAHESDSFAVVLEKIN